MHTAHAVEPLYNEQVGQVFVRYMEVSLTLRFCNVYQQIVRYEKVPTIGSV